MTEAPTQDPAVSKDKTVDPEGYQRPLNSGGQANEVGGHINRGEEEAGYLDPYTSTKDAANSNSLAPGPPRTGGYIKLKDQ